MTTNQPVPTPSGSSSSDGGRMSQIERQVIAQALVDPAFRDRLMADPKAVMAEKGLEIPTDIQINVVKETPNTYYLVLPSLDLPQSGSGLTDAQLEAVVGGGAWEDCEELARNGNSKNELWTGCASGQSGCIATNGCYQVLSAFNEGMNTRDTCLPETMDCTSVVC